MKVLCSILSPTASPAQTPTSAVSYPPGVPRFQRRSWSPVKQNWVLSRRKRSENNTSQTMCTAVLPAPTHTEVFPRRRQKAAVAHASPPGCERLLRVTWTAWHRGTAPSTPVLPGQKEGTGAAAQIRRKAWCHPLSPHRLLPSSAGRMTGISAESSVTPCPCATILIYPLNQAPSMHTSITQSIKLCTVLGSGLHNSYPISESMARRARCQVLLIHGTPREK